MSRPELPWATSLRPDTGLVSSRLGEGATFSVELPLST